MVMDGELGRNTFFVFCDMLHSSDVNWDATSTSPTDIPSKHPRMYGLGFSLCAMLLDIVGSCISK